MTRRRAGGCAGPGRCCVVWGGCRACGGVQVRGGGAGGGGLVGALLGKAEVGDGFGECGQPDDEQG
jgi:hypothetical protein